MTADTSPPVIRRNKDGLDLALLHVQFPEANNSTIFGLSGNEKVWIGPVAFGRETPSPRFDLDRIIVAAGGYSDRLRMNLPQCLPVFYCRRSKFDVNA